MNKYLRGIAVVLISITAIGAINFLLFHLGIRNLPEWFGRFSILCFFGSLYTIPIQLILSIDTLVFTRNRWVGILLLVSIATELICLSTIEI
jgi:ABC-type multidrug transport system permease subunit